MAISFVGGKTSGSNTGWTTSLTDLTGGSGSAPAAGDVVVIYYGGNEVASGFGVTGYTEILETSYDNSTSTDDLSLGVYYKVMGGTPDTDVSFSGMTGPDEELAVIMVFRGVDPNNPIDATLTSAFGTGSQPNPPSITPATTGAWIVAGGAVASDNTGTPTLSSSELSGFTQVFGDNGNSDLQVGAGYYAWTSGAFDPAAITNSRGTSSDYSWIAATLALRPKITPRSQGLIIF